MIAVGLGLLIASAFGSGDFAGGRASVSTPTLLVLLVAQMCSLLGAAVLVLFVSAHAGMADIVYGALAGGVNVIGLGLLYRALARHAAGVVAPLTAVVGALVPVAWGLAHGERPSGLVFAGIALSIVAGALVSRSDADATQARVARGVVPAVLAGTALGSSLVLYAESSPASGQVPVVAGRVAAVVCVGVAFLATRRRSSGALALPAGGLAAAAGLLDVTATALLLVAVRRELLSVVAPLASLAPGWTVLLAWALSKEHLGTPQRAGLAIALLALVCIAAG